MTVGQPSGLSLVLVNVDFPPVGGPGVWRMLALAKYAALSGHSVRIVCSDRATWHDFVDRSLLEQIPSSVEIVRLSAPHSRDIQKWFALRAERTRSRALRRTLQALSWRVRSYAPDEAWLWGLSATIHVAWHAFRHKPDCIVTSGPPHVSHLAGLVARNLLRTPWIVDYRDPWTDDPDEVAPGRAYRRALRRAIERRVLARSSRVVTVSPAWTRDLQQKLVDPTQRPKVRLIRNGQDLEETTRMSVGPSNGSGFRTGDRLHVHFSGTVQDNNSTVIRMILAALDMPSKDTVTRSLLFTFARLTPAIQQEVIDRGLSGSVVEVGYMSHSDSVAFSCQAHVLLVPINLDSGGAMGVIPAKAYEAMALGKHILCLAPPGSDLEAVIREYGNASICDPTDTEAIRRAVRQLVDAHDAAVSSGSPSPFSATEPRLQTNSRRQRSLEFLDLIEEVVRNERSQRNPSAHQVVPPGDDRAAG